jgi:hypothetical protein
MSDTQQLLRIATALFDDKTNAGVCVPGSLAFNPAH